MQWLLYFIPSYILYYSSIKSISKQTEIREEIIDRAKHNKQDQAIIPDYYFPPVLHAGPSLDTFNSEAMSRYYGIDLKITAPDFSTIHEPLISSLLILTQNM